MYRSCWVHPDQPLVLIIAVLSLIVLGMACAIARHMQSTRRYREAFEDQLEINRLLRLRLNSLRFENLFDRVRGQ